MELFAGAGGATTGLIEARLDVVRCVEWDRDAHATAIAAGHPSVLGDVRDPSLDVEDIDLLWSSFPCQAWSLAGKRLGPTDARNGWPWTVDAIDRMGPSWFAGENVVGLTLHSRREHVGGVPVDLGRCPGCYFDRVILAELRERFEEVSWKILDAADYGVPQHRRRVFIVAGPRASGWPGATHCGAASGRRAWNTMGGALGLVGGSARPGTRAESQPELLGRPAPTVTTTEVKGTRGEAMRGGPDRASDALWLATGVRRLTVAQCAALQAFPPDYPWRGNQASVYRQIGNAVPPVMGEVVGRAVGASV